MTNATAFYPAPDLAAAVTRGLAAVRDRPDPEFDADCSAQKYAGMAQDFRASAWEHLDKGDLAQASNKAWGLVAETVKAISAHYGGIIHSHRAVWQVVHELARLVATPAIWKPGAGLPTPSASPAACTPTSTRIETRNTTSWPG